MLQSDSSKTFTQSVLVPRGNLTLDGQEPDLFTAPAGIMQSSRGFQWDQIVTRIAVHVVWSGAGAMVVNGHEYRVQGGDIFIFFPGLHIRHYDFPETPWHYTWFGLNGRRAAWALALCGLTPQHPHRPDGITPTLEKHVHELMHVYRQPGYPSGFPISWAWQFISLLEREKTPTATNKSGPWLAQACRTLIESGPTTGSSVKELAAQLNVERTTLFRHFREVYGTSPKNYMEAYRMQKAGALLQNTRLRIKEVAVSCGFSDANYFCRIFRARHGVSPHAWREAQLRRQEVPGNERPVNFTDLT